MSLLQINRINRIKIRRMNQLPIEITKELFDNISDSNKKDDTLKIVKLILYDMIDLIETNHNFEYVKIVNIPKKKNIFKKILSYTKKIIYQIN